MNKLSSDHVPDGPFPIKCASCGRTTVMPISHGTTVDEHELQLTVQCSECGRQWTASAPNAPMALRRKPDRRDQGPHR